MPAAIFAASPSQSISRPCGSMAPTFSPCTPRPARRSRCAGPGRARFSSRQSPGAGPATTRCGPNPSPARPTCAWRPASSRRVASTPTGSRTTIRCCAWHARSRATTAAPPRASHRLTPPRASASRTPSSSRWQALSLRPRPPSSTSSPEGAASMPRQSYAEALVDALYDSLAADPRVSLIGSYVLGLGPQRHLMERVRKTFHDRVADPPTAEAGAAATGIGAAMAGVRPFVDLGTGSFPYLAWSQIVNEAAISCYMSDGRIPVPVTFHLLHGVRGGGAAQHSHSPQSMLCNAPGLEIVAPATATDVYGLVRSAFQSPNPTVVVSHAKLLGIESDVPAQKQPIPIGRAEIKRGGGGRTRRRGNRGRGGRPAHPRASRRDHDPQFGCADRPAGRRR